MFRDKVIIDETKIEYVQFTYKNRRKVYDAIAYEQPNIKATYDKYGKKCLIVPSPNGIMTCHEGDYIIKDPNSKGDCVFICCNWIVFRNLMKIFGMAI